MYVYSVKSNHQTRLVICDCELCGVANEFQPCDTDTQQCICKRDVEGARCDQCKPGFHSLSFSNETGCQQCDCGTGGFSPLPCNPETGQCYCKEGFSGSTCEVMQGSYVPSLEQIFSITEIALDPLDTPSYLLDTFASNQPPRVGWRVSSEEPFEVRFSVDQSGTYFFKPLISYSMTATRVTILFTPDTNATIPYSIAVGYLLGWSVDVPLSSSELYTVSVSVEPLGSLAVVEDLLYLPLDGAGASRDEEVLREVYAQCVPYPFPSQANCSEAVSVSATLAQSASGWFLKFCIIFTYIQLRSIFRQFVTDNSLHSSLLVGRLCPF